MTKSPLAAAVIASLIAMPDPSAYADDLVQSCETLLDRELPVWTIASASEEVKALAAQRRADPVRIRGDFDGDGRQDIALLIQIRVRPVFEEPDRIKATRIAVCLAKTPSMVLRLIEKPYCDDFIYLVRKGQDMDDVEAGHLGKYPVDAIGTSCFEKAGAVFYFDGRIFRQVINGD